MIGKNKTNEIRYLECDANENIYLKTAIVFRERFIAKNLSLSEKKAKLLIHVLIKIIKHIKGE